MPISVYSYCNFKSKFLKEERKMKKELENLIFGSTVIFKGIMGEATVRSANFIEEFKISNLEELSQSKDRILAKKGGKRILKDFEKMGIEFK
ncbi:hypothetical protein C4572_01500 [Candidatus Parcubacteria bacterium]|nr:MAG: hypothetical protein C4572_01500 [Candidatus Parcubacteria bacterium]